MYPDMACVATKPSPRVPLSSDHGRRLRPARRCHERCRRLTWKGVSAGVTRRGHLTWSARVRHRSSCRSVGVPPHRWCRARQPGRPSHRSIAASHHLRSLGRARMACTISSSSCHSTTPTSSRLLLASITCRPVDGSDAALERPRSRGACSVGSTGPTAAAMGGGGAPGGGTACGGTPVSPPWLERAAVQRR